MFPGTLLVLVQQLQAPPCMQMGTPSHRPAQGLGTAAEPLLRNLATPTPGHLGVHFHLSLPACSPPFFLLFPPPCERQIHWGTINVPTPGHLRAGERMWWRWPQPKSQYRHSFHFLYPSLERMWSLPACAGGTSHLFWLSPLAVLCLQCDDSLEALLVLTPSLLPKGQSPFATTFCRYLSAVPWPCLSSTAQLTSWHLVQFSP